MEWVRTEFFLGPKVNDFDGFIYVYYSNEDMEKADNGERFKLKIGRTKHEPSWRITTSARSNTETYIKILDYFSKYHCFMEYILHRMFKEARVRRKNISDGKTEWFLLTKKEVTEGCRKVRSAMQIVFGDYSEQEAAILKTK